MTEVLSKLQSFSFVPAIFEKGGQVYLVGGSVRDQLLKRPIKDFDLVVCHLPFDTLTQLLKKEGHVNLVGKSFGIIKFHPKQDPTLEIDIALPRQENSTGIGHKDFDVHFDENLPLAKDLLRRDFTINAMAQNLQTGELIDPTKGQQDLKNKVIRTVFDNSFQEDPLRLLRAIQFAARLGFQVESETTQQIKDNASSIKNVAPERIVTEIKKLFSAKKPSDGFDLMRDTGLLPYVFPDIQKSIGVLQPKKNNEDVYDHTMKVLNAARGAEELDKAGDLDIMFAALFHDMGKPKTRRENEEKVTFFNHQHISTGIAWRWMKENKITTIGVNPHHVCHLVKHHMFETKPFEDNDKALRRFINKVGKENILDLIDLRLADKKGGRFPKKVYGILQLRKRIIEEINRKAPFTTKDLALKGQDIVEIGYQPGPIIGEIQRFLLDQVLDTPDLNTKEQLTKIVNEHKDKFNS